ncbi:MAG TPA: M20/M25/M40 family metallo-hydrolase [Allosphingosinicella sp.]|jgi:acetylornithine deacetylase/succinyl-diaminopimelate desuccinylase-like protein
MRFTMILAAASAALLGSAAQAQGGAPHEAQARAMLERVITFRSAEGQKQVPPMAAYLAETLRAGGVAADEIAMLPLGETTGMLVRVAGRDSKAKPILFSGHMDVVDARPEDWTRDPFKLVEEDGYFFGRGVLDNKTGVVALASTILRLRQEGKRPQRTLVFAFVGDEESTFGTTKLIADHPWVKGAEFAINTDAGDGILGPDGKPLIYLVQGAEKTYATFDVTATNAGGHSSRPRTDNAIYDLARALGKIGDYRFPVMSSELTRAQLAAVGKVTPGETGGVLRRFAANPQDKAAADALFVDPSFVGLTRTTCVATMLDAGHAENALPQRANAKVNCRIFPGVAVEDVRRELEQVIGNPAIAVKTTGDPVQAPASEPRKDVMEAIARDIHRRHPGIPVAPNLESGATDGVIYRMAGIPTFASSGVFMKQEDMFAHGLNERIPVKAFYESVDHIYRLAVDLGGAK